MNIYLGKHFEELIRAQVESGRYANASEVVREALRRYEIDEEKLARLRAKLDEAEEEFRRGKSVEVIDVRAFIEGIRDQALARAKAARSQEEVHAAS